MSDDNLFKQLVAQATSMTAVANLVADLDDQAEDMLRPQINAMRAILDRCPGASGDDWLDANDELREDDIDEKVYGTLATTFGGSNAVKLVHTPSGIGRQSESKPTAEENRAVARRALTNAVRDELSKRRAE